MMSSNRWFGACVCSALGCVLLSFAAGCHSAKTPAEWSSRFIDSRLPEGFYPLPGHNDQQNPDDYYGEWPRYIVSEKDNMIMAYVPTQTIMMGGGPGDDEVPARAVVVNHFYMDLNEVSNIQFDRFRMLSDEAKGACSKSKLAHYRAKDRPLEEFEAYKMFLDGAYSGLSPEGANRPHHDEYFKYWRGKTPADIDYYLEYWQPGVNNSHPVRNVSWWEAWYYTKWTGKRLPTEAQWEAAARGADRRIYPWGNEDHLEQTKYLCNCKTGRGDFDGYEYTAPVLNYAAGVSPHGIFNMAGNVWEWCADWYDPGRYAYPSQEDPPSALDRGTKAFGDSNYPNPIDKDIRTARVGPLRGDERAVRGGSFADPLDKCRVDVRFSARPDAHQNNVGFRCILPLCPEGAGQSAEAPRQG